MKDTLGRDYDPLAFDDQLFRSTRDDDFYENDEDVIGDLEVYETIKARASELKRIEDTYKKRLKAYVESVGDPDSKGSLWVTLPNGRQLKLQRSSSKYLDEEFAIDWLEARPELAETCLVWTLTVDDDALLAARYQGLITDEELAQIYKETETFSFVLPKK